MYKNKHQGNRNSYNSRPNRGNFGRGQRSIKVLDPNLFIRKATEENTTAPYISTLNFSDFKLVEKLKRNVEERGYKTPTAIQEKSIPHILEGRDLIGIADTGTGKTAAFLLTLINKSYLDHNQRALIVVPTRELAIQIADEFKIFAKGTELEIVATVGGANIKRQSYALRHRPHFVVGTPGRLKDLIERRDLNLAQFQNVVLDEVDRMVDIGFIKDIKYIISLLPKTRQSLFFSATVDQKTQDILTHFVNNPITVSVKKENTINNIDQDIIKLTNGISKIDALHNLLVEPGFEKVIIFGRTKWGMEKLSKSLKERGFRAASIHGNKSQNQRQRALEEFKSEKIQILIATDVASRGIDIDNVTHVINYDPPETFEDYTHRIGRTGRAGKRGSALTFVD